MAGVTIPVIPLRKGLSTAVIGKTLVGAERLAWNSDRALSDFELVVAKPHFAEFSYDSQKDYGGNAKRNAQASAYAAMRHWESELAPFLRSGKTLVVLLGKPQYLSLDALSNAPQYISAWDLVGLPLTDVAQLTVKRPKLTKYGEQVFGDHADLIQKFEIGCTFKAAGAKPLLVTDDDTDRWLAADLRVGVGRIVILPETKHWNRSPSPIGHEGLKKEVQAEENALARFAQTVKQAVARSEPPSWAASANWKTQTELEADNKLVALTEQIQQIDALRAELTSRRAQIRDMRALLYANGDELEKVVRLALKALGFAAEPFDDGKLRIDARFDRDGITYVCEIEGKDNKPIEISKYRQLMDMCLGEQQRLGEGAKVRGILFGNGLRTKAPEERGSQFTDQVVSNASGQGVLLVTTEALYRAWMEVADGSQGSIASNLRAAILSDVAGPYQG